MVGSPMLRQFDVFTGVPVMDNFRPQDPRLYRLLWVLVARVDVSIQSSVLSW